MVTNPRVRVTYSVLREQVSNARIDCSRNTEYVTRKGMEVSESIQCPFCGQAFELAVDTSIDSQRFTTDCEVCCRPFEVTVECEPGEILSLDVSGN
jgi:hypothetical protein